MVRFTHPTILNVIPYCRSYGAHKTGGCEVAGWPLTFFARCTKIVYTERFDVAALIIDVLAAVGLSAAAGIALRNGTGPLLATARAVIRRVRTWPSQDDAQPVSSDDGSRAD